MLQTWQHKKNPPNQGQMSAKLFGFDRSKIIAHFALFNKRFLLFFFLCPLLLLLTGSKE